VYTRIIKGVLEDGYILLEKIFSDEQLQALFIDIKQTGSEHFRAAGIGRDQDHQLNRFVRRDRIRWLEPGYQPADFYLDWNEQLRQRLNQELFLGLFDYECHYAHYPNGAFYKKHVDAFKGVSSRRLTTILYLNPDWQPNDGGELVIYAEDSQSVLETVLPTFGTMVLFLSEDFPHEVLSAKRSRYSLTGWFRINNTDSLNLDPQR
jgi:SM-20-related protein